MKKNSLIYFLLLFYSFLYSELVITYTTTSETPSTYNGRITISNTNTRYVWDGLFYNIWGVEFITTSQITSVTGAKRYTIKDNLVFIEIPDWQKAIGLNTTLTINFVAQKSGNLIYPQNLKARYMRGPVLYPDYDDLPGTWSKNKQNLSINDLIKDPQDYYSEAFNYMPDSMIIYKPPHKTQIYIGQATSVYMSGTPNVRIWIPSKYLAMGIAFAYEIFKINPNYMCALATKENWTCGVYHERLGVFTTPVLIDGTTWYWGMTAHPDGPFQQEPGNFTDCKAFYPDYLPDNASHSDYVSISVSTTDPRFITSAISAAISLTLLRELYNAVPTLWFQDFCLNAKDSFAELVFITFGYNRGWLALNFDIFYPDRDRKNALEVTDLIAAYNLGGFGDHVTYIRDATKVMNRSDNIYDEKIYWQDMQVFFQRLRMFYGRGIPSDSEWQQMISDVQRAFNLLASRWGSNYVRFRYDFLTLLRVMKKYLPTPYNPSPKGVEWKDRLTGAGFRLDVEDLPPQITINSPQNNSSVSGIVNFDVTVTDDNYAKDGGVRKVYCYYVIYGVTNTIILSNGGSGRRYTASASLPNGTVNLTFIAEDIIGNTTTKNITLNVSNIGNTPPVAKLQLIDGLRVSGIFKLEAICSDREYIRMVEFYINNNFVVRFSSNPTNLYSYSLDTTKLPNGPIVVKVITYDDIYQVATDTATLIVMNVSGDELPYGWFEPPTPLENSVLTSTVTICVFANDDKGISNVEFYLDTTYISNFSYVLNNRYYLTFDTSRYKNGKRTLIVAVCDTAGQVVYLKRNFTLNNPNAPHEDNSSNTPPVISINNPKNGEIINKQTTSVVSISFSVFDNDGISFVELYINDVKHYEVNSPTISVINYNWSVLNISTGNYIIRVIAQDRLGLRTSVNVNVKVETEITPPLEEETYVEIVSPKDKESIGRTSSLFIIAKTSSNVQISKVEFYVNETKVKSVNVGSYSGIYDYVWDTTQIPLGTYVLKVIVYTVTGSTISHQISVTLTENITSTINFIWPPINNYQLEASTTILISITDEESSKVFVDLKLNDTLLISNTYYLTNKEIMVSYFLDINMFTSGNYLITIEVVNEKGLVAKAFRTINLIKRPPEIELNIGDKSVLKGEIDLKIKVLNNVNKILSAIVFLDSQQILFQDISDFIDEISFKLNTNFYPNGQYELKVLVIFENNDSIEKKLNISINNIAAEELAKNKIFLTEKIIFNPTKNIVDFTKSSKGMINLKEIKIYDSIGRLVKYINSYPFEWDGCAENGKKLKSGVYFYILTTTDSKTKKGEILLLR